MEGGRFDGSFRGRGSLPFRGRGGRTGEFGLAVGGYSDFHFAGMLHVISNVTPLLASESH